MNIVLIGFMGSGKTTVGHYVARKLLYEFREMDTIILAKNGFGDMQELFSKKGESYLRASEIALSKELAAQSNTVISTGGGVVMNKIIIDNFKKRSSLIVYLHAPFDLLAQRIAQDSTPRPLFDNIDEAQTLFEYRLPLYKNFSDYTVDIQNKSIEKIADEIVEIYKSL